MILTVLLVAFSLQNAAMKGSDTRTLDKVPVNRSLGTDSLPISVKLINTGQSDSAVMQEAARIREEQAARDSNLTLTKSLVGATILTLFVLVYQSYWLRRSVTHSEKATSIDLRAYLNPAEVSLLPTGVRVVIKNVGKTPAHEISVWRHTYHGPKSLWNKDWQDRQWANEGLTLAPGATIQNLSDVPELTSDDKVQIAGGDPAIIAVHGVVRYRDVFGVNHETEYAYDAEVANLKTRSINITSGYNRAT